MDRYLIKYMGLSASAPNKELDIGRTLKKYTISIGTQKQLHITLPHIFWRTLSLNSFLFVPIIHLDMRGKISSIAMGVWIRGCMDPGSLGLSGGFLLV